MGEVNVGWDSECECHLGLEAPVFTAGALGARPHPVLESAASFLPSAEALDLHLIGAQQTLQRPS